jgi:hypothetical protein
MKMILEFNLPDDAYEAKAAQCGSALLSILQEYDNRLRSYCKHGDPSDYDAEKCREILWDLIKEENLDIHNFG